MCALFSSMLKDFAKKFILAAMSILPPPQMEESWKIALKEEWAKTYLQELASFIANERKGPTPVYPSKSDVFNAFNLAPFEKVQVVIIGQDPYHGPGQAHGLSFSVPYKVSQPPSLKNIFKELQEDLGIRPLLGRGKASCCSMPCSLCVRTRRALIMEKGGKLSPMPSWHVWFEEKIPLSLFFGEKLLKKNAGIFLSKQEIVILS